MSEQWQIFLDRKGMASNSMLIQPKIYFKTMLFLTLLLAIHFIELHAEVERFHFTILHTNNGISPFPSPDSISLLLPVHGRIHGYGSQSNRYATFADYANFIQHMREKENATHKVLVFDSGNMILVWNLFIYSI